MYAPRSLVSAEASSSGLRKRTHFCLTPSEINLAAIKNKRAAVKLYELRPLVGDADYSVTPCVEK